MQEPTIAEVREYAEKLRDKKNEGLSIQYKDGYMDCARGVLHFLTPKPRPAAEIIVEMCLAHTNMGRPWVEIADEMVEALRAEGYDV